MNHLEIVSRDYFRDRISLALAEEVSRTAPYLCRELDKFIPVLELMEGDGRLMEYDFSFGEFTLSEAGHDFTGGIPLPLFQLLRTAACVKRDYESIGNSVIRKALKNREIQTLYMELINLAHKRGYYSRISFQKDLSPFNFEVALLFHSLVRQPLFRMALNRFFAECTELLFDDEQTALENFLHLEQERRQRGEPQLIPEIQQSVARLLQNLHNVPGEILVAGRLI